MKPQKATIGCYLWLMIVWCPLILMACDKPSIPDASIGRWICDNPRYRNCSLLINRDQISFGTSDGIVNEFEISDVSMQQDDQSQVITVHYTDTDKKASFTCQWIYCAEQGGKMWLKNQPQIIWRRHNLLPYFYGPEIKRIPHIHPALSLMKP